MKKTILISTDKVKGVFKQTKAAFIAAFVCGVDFQQILDDLEQLISIINQIN